MRRLLAALLLVGVLVVVALVAALAWFGATAAGTRALFDRFAPLAAPMVRVGTVDGRLLGPLELHELVIALPAARVEVAQATLRWRPRALMRGTLAIVELAVSGVQVIVRESADEETPSSTLATPLLPPLPLALRVEALAVRDVTLADAPGRLVSLTLAATLDGDQVRLDDIALEAVSGAGEALVLGGEVALADGATPVLAATLGGRLEAAPPVSADIALSGPLSGLRVDARVEGAGPVPLTLGGQLDLLAAVPAFALALEADAVALGDAEEAVRIGPSLVGLNGSAAAFDLALDSRLERPGAAPRAINLAATVNAPDSAAGSGWRGTFEWHARAETGPWPQLGGDGEVSYTGAMLSVTHRGDAPLASRLEATLRELDATPLVDARLTAEGLDIPLENAQTLSLERLAAQAKGPLDRLAVTVVANGHQALGGRIALDLAGELGERHFTLERLAAELLGGQLQADGTLRFAPTPGGEVAFAASGLDLAYLDVALDSALAFSGTATFEQHDEQLRGTVALEELGGAWRGHAVAGRLNLEVDGAAARLRDAVLTLGDNRLEVNADIGETLTGRFDLRAPDLGKLAPGLQGELAASGSVGGSRTAPRVEAELAGRDLAGPAWSVASIAGDVALDLASTGAQRVDVTLRGVSAGGRALGELVLDADGTLDAHRLEATLSGGEPTLRLVANGAWQAPAWQGRIETLALGDTPLGDWVLRAPATLAASATRVDLGAACLVQAEARLCVALDEWLTDGGAATLDLAGLPLASFADYLPTTVRVRGELGGEARFTAATGGITGDARFAVSAAGVSVTRADGRTETVALEDTAVDVTLAPAALTARLRAALGDWLDVDGELRYGLTSDHALDGRFALRADQLAWLEEFVPQLAGTHGALALDATLGGDQARPAVTLETRLRDGAIVLPASGTRIAQLALDARTRDSRTLVVDGEFGDGEHVVTLAGRVELDARAGWPGRLEVRGEDFALLRQPDVEADISPDLALEFSTDHLAIGGRLALPHVLVTLSSLPPSPMAVSPNEVIIDDAAAPTAATPP
ncbi:MAG: translocation/assembly module TamB domain-containing protein, partial [Gammaproteobacteria bacterium]